MKWALCVYAFCFLMMLSFSDEWKNGIGGIVYVGFVSLLGPGVVVMRFFRADYVKGDDWLTALISLAFWTALFLWGSHRKRPAPRASRLPVPVPAPPQEFIKKIRTVRVFEEDE